MMFFKSKNILFITSTRLGDAVLSTGILNYFIQQNSQAQFTIACGPVAAGLFEHMPQRKRTLVMEKRSYDRHWFDLWRACIGQPWDRIIDLRGSCISYLLWARKRQMVHGGRFAEHRTHYLARAFKLDMLPLPVVWTNPKDDQKALEYLPKDSYIALAPTANWDGKIWPAGNFINLAKQFLSINSKLQFAVFYGPGEKEYAMASPLLHADLPVIDVGGRFSLSEVTSLLQRCQGFIGNDSGLMHLSAAANVPTLGLFGPSRVIEYAPVGKKTRAVIAPGPEGEAPIAALTVEKVFQSCQGLFF